MQKNDEKDLAQETTAGETPETTEKETEGSEASQAKEAAEEKTPEELLQEQCSQLNDKYMRILAEYDNFRKRSQRE